MTYFFTMSFASTSKKINPVNLFEPNFLCRDLGNLLYLITGISFVYLVEASLFKISFSN